VPCRGSNSEGCRGVFGLGGGIYCLPHCFSRRWGCGWSVLMGVQPSPSVPPCHQLTSLLRMLLGLVGYFHLLFCLAVGLLIGRMDLFRRSVLLRSRQTTRVFTASIIRQSQGRIVISQTDVVQRSVGAEISREAESMICSFRMFG
jgi:hypothetical protein